MIPSVWWKSTRFWIVTAITLYLLVGILVVPPLVKNLLTSAITERTTLEPTIETVKFDPITFTLRLRDLRLRNSGEAVLETDGVTVNFDPLSSVYRWDWSLGKVGIQSPRISVSRDNSGRINWSQFYVPPDDPKDPSDAPAKRSIPPDTAYYSVDRFRLTNGTVNWADRAQSPEANLTLSRIGVDLNNLHWPLRETSTLRLRAAVGQKGVFRARGSLYGDTRTVVSDFSLAEFSLPDTNEYLRTRTKAQWKSGRLSLRGSLRASGSPLDVKFKGQSAIRNALLVSLNGDTVAGWKKTSIDNIDLAWPGREVRVGPVEVEGALLVMEIDENYRTNLGRLLVPRPKTRADTVAKPPKPPKPPKLPKPWSGSVGPVRVTSANLDFTDVNVPGTFHAVLKDLGGLIGEVSTAKNDTAGVSLEGTLGDQSTVSLDGSISPLSLSTRSTITMEIANVGLPTLSQYSAKFLGYKIDRGKLRSILQYGIEDGRLSGDNHVVLEEFTLGKYVGNAIIGIPMRLAVALLKDSNGMITLDVPVSGNVKDPSFDFTTVIYHSVQSVLTSVVKSPFAFLSGLVNSEPDELKYVEFEPADGTITDHGRDGLTKLVTVMEKRPLITVGVRPGWTERDRRTLAEQSLDNYLSREGGNPEDLSQSIGSLELRFRELAGSGALSDLRQKHDLEEGLFSDTPDGEAYAKDLYRLNREKTEVNPEKLKAIAQNRASNIRVFLREQGIASDRIFVLDATEFDTRPPDSVVTVPLTVEG